MRLILSTLLALACAVSFGQNVKVRSKGDDVQKVIDSVFEQAGYQYVLESDFKQQLYMNLENVPFGKAIDIIGRIADLRFEQKQGIWYVSKRAKTTPASHPEVLASNNTTTTISKGTVAQGFAPAGAVKPAVKGASNAAKSSPPPSKPIEKVDLSRKVTVKMRRVMIHDVFEELGRQGKVKFELDSQVPFFKLDVSFFNLPLSNVVEKICKAAKLKTTIRKDQTVIISKA